MGAIRINPETGNYIGYYENEFIQQGWTMISEPLLEPNPFTVSQWNFDTLVWQEGATAQEIFSIKSPIYEQKITDSFRYLMLRALSSSMNKTGNYEDLMIIKEEYEDKYSVASGQKVNPAISEAIEKEMIRDFPESVLEDVLNSYGITPTGTHLEKMYQLIVFRYNYANTRYNRFKGFIIDFRTKCRTFVEQSNWNKLDEAFLMIKDLPIQLTDEQIQTIYNQFDAL